MTINETLTQIFSTKKGYEKYGYNPNTWASLKRRFLNNQSIPKESVLLKCKAVKIKDSEWKL